MRAGPDLAVVKGVRSGSAVHMVEKTKGVYRNLRQKEASLAFGDGSQ